MDDFPLWLKLIVWLSLGSVVVYTSQIISLTHFSGLIRRRVTECVGALRRSISQSP